MCKSNKEILGFKINTILRFIGGITTVSSVLYMAINFGCFIEKINSSMELSKINESKIEIIEPSIFLLKEIEKKVENNTKDIKKILPALVEIQTVMAEKNLIVKNKSLVSVAW